MHISGSTDPSTLIWKSLERSFPLAEVEYYCVFDYYYYYYYYAILVKGETSEVEQRPGLVTGG